MRGGSATDVITIHINRSFAGALKLGHIGLYRPNIIPSDMVLRSLTLLFYEKYTLL